MTNPAAPLTLLHVASHAGVYRGGAVQLCRMAVEQARRGHHVEVVANMPRALPPAERERHLASWQPLHAAAIPLHTLPLDSLRGVWALRCLLRAGHFDAVHVHRDQALVATWLASWGLTDRPPAVAQRGTVSAPSRWARRALASPATGAIVAVAGAVRAAVIGAVGPAAADKTHVVYGSVDLEHFQPREASPDLRRQLDLPAHAWVLGSLSAWRRDKGFDLLIKSLAAVIADERAAGAYAPPREIYALFLGEGVREHVLPMAEANGIADRCRFVGHQPDVAVWLPLMNVTVVAAHKREGLSGVLRESLAMEVPVITTECAGNTEIVRDGETGLLVPVGDAAALERALRRALADPAALQHMANAGRTWVETHCSLTTQANALEHIYRMVAQSR